MYPVVFLIPCNPMFPLNTYEAQFIAWKSRKSAQTDLIRHLMENRRLEVYNWDKLEIPLGTYTKDHPGGRLEGYSFKQIGQDFVLFNHHPGRWQRAGPPLATSTSQLWQPERSQYTNDPSDSGFLGDSSDNPLNNSLLMTRPDTYLDQNGMFNGFPVYSHQEANPVGTQTYPHAAASWDPRWTVPVSYQGHDYLWNGLGWTQAGAATAFDATWMSPGATHESSISLRTRQSSQSTKKNANSHSEMDPDLPVIVHG